ncbi:hypothetical protein ACTIVE_3184 [Actinomadura verrucosospora]|uniref:Uncharacterized protein n=1 Tax=Actinomadura verrucosospora TaxID=46165 RepID=A0A7D3ZX23_ACTVE|nr:hypothetical protein ACTIVE_3184 [Actinomadura verrucosospora]
MCLRTKIYARYAHPLARCSLGCRCPVEPDPRLTRPAGDVAFEAPEGFATGFAFGLSAGDVVTGAGFPAKLVARAQDGRIFTAVNVYRFTGGPCAEPVLLARRPPRTPTSWITIVAVGDRDRGIVPTCGRCRQGPPLMRAATRTASALSDRSSTTTAAS